MPLDLAALKKILGSGLLAFPVTHFKSDLSFDEQPYRRSINENIGHGAAGLFAPGGTGECFSLTMPEAERVMRAAVEEARGRVPVVGGAGYGTAIAIDFAKAAERACADAALLLPPYLLGVEQAGLDAHVDAVCKAIGIGVIIYNRDNAIYSAETVARRVRRHNNLIGYKDGHGDVEQLVGVRQMLGDRLVYIGGMPTSEVFAVPYFAAGFTIYSSAVFNFIPKTAMQFFNAVRAGDRTCGDRLLGSLYLPYVSLRNRRKGYAVSIVKAGMRIVGRPAGPVRPPLTDLSADEQGELARIVQSAQAT
jgi:5-dehydro-4-deoxyglucarate dehydratase